LVVNKTFHNTDASSKLMNLLIEKAMSMELTSIFALSKYGGRFFFRFDFNEAKLSSLPESRQKSYDYARSSIIYARKL
jgi:N-acetylglutamate synthase-like GNAT family acetyltransferase